MQLGWIVIILKWTHKHIYQHNTQSTMRFVYWNQSIHLFKAYVLKSKDSCIFSLQFINSFFLSNWICVDLLVSDKNTERPKKITYYLYIYYLYPVCELGPYTTYIRFNLGSDFLRLRVCFALSSFQLDLRLNSENGGDISTYVTNGEWDLIGKQTSTVHSCVLSN